MRHEKESPLLIPLRNNIITKEHIIGDLHQIVSAKLVARNDRDEITIFKSVGFALEDLVVASLVYDRLLLHQGSAAESP